MTAPIDWVLRRIIGGTTGTRHSALFAVVVQFGFLAWGCWGLTQGTAVGPLFDLLTITLPTSIGMLIGASAHQKYLNHISGGNAPEGEK